jgi:uncharacterized protein YutE (UPF0331/DUF86 family)
MENSDSFKQTSVECCKKCCHCTCNRTDTYTWQHLLFIVDMMVQKGVLTESQIRKIIDIIDIKKLVNHNKLSPQFIENILRPIVENNFDSDSSSDLTMNDIFKIQNYKNNKK